MSIAGDHIRELFIDELAEVRGGEGSISPCFPSTSACGEEQFPCHPGCLTPVGDVLEILEDILPR